MSASLPRQLILDLPVQAATGAGDFLVSPSNDAAVALIENWPSKRSTPSQEGALHESAIAATTEPSAALLVGPPSCGKSHLAAVWRSRTGATMLAATDLSDATVTHFQQQGVRALVVEDIDRGIADQRILFHLLNHARETQRSILLTSRTAPGDLDIALPDLRSRLRAVAMITIAEPDDALLSAVLVKLFADRQLAVEPSVISYLLRHMDRSFAAASTTISAIDAIALARQRKVTRAIAAEALARFSDMDDGT